MTGNLTKQFCSYLRASMVSAIPPIHILGNTVIISMNQFMNNDLIYLILKSHVIAAHFYLGRSR